MAKMNQVYGIGQALIPSLPPPLPFENAPTSNQTNYEIGQIVYTPPTNPTSFYIYAGGGTWSLFGSSSGDIVAVVGTANEITVTSSAGTATVSLPSAITAPGSLTTTTSLSATTTVTAGTTVTATLGDITATNGNFVGSTAGTGFQFNANTATGAAASPIVLNSRAGAAVFTSVSIAGGADLTLTITNSEITDASTQVIYCLSGVTTGAALSIKSVTNSAGSSAVVVTNGTGLTTSTADITLTFLVVN